MAQTFTIVPAVGSWSIVIIAVPCLALFTFAVIRVGASLWGAQRARFELNDAALVLHGDFYGRAIPRSAIVGREVRLVNLEREEHLKPVRRTMGTAIPGYRAGWFRLANGAKALLYVTDECRVVYIPTTAGYVVLLSAAKPGELMRLLQTESR